MNKRSLRASFLVLATFAAAACGTNSVNYQPVATPTPSNAAPAVGTLPSFTTTASAAVAAGASATVPLSSASAGVTASIALPAQATAGTASATMSNANPIGVTLQSMARAPQGSRSVQNESVPITGILYFTFAISAPPPITSFTFTPPPSFTITLPASFFSTSNTAFYLAYYDPTKPTLGWQSRAETCLPGTNSTLTCTGTGSATVLNNVNYFLALYAVAATAPSPTPEPSVVPTTPATIPPTASPTATASPTPSASPSPAASAFAVVYAPGTPSAGATAQPLPTVGGITASVQLGGGYDASGTFNGTASSTPPVGIPSVTGAIYYATFTPSVTTTAGGYSVATFTIPGAASNGASYYLATYDPTDGWILGAVGPVSPDGTGTVTLTTTVGNMGLIAGTTYGFALYTTATPTNATETITVSPTSGPITLPTFNGAGGSLSFGSFSVSDGSGATTSKVTFQTWTSLPPFAIAPPQTGAFYPPLFITVTASHQVTVSNVSGIGIPPTGWTPPNSGSGVNGYLELYAPRSTGSWFVNVAGAGTPTTQALASPLSFSYSPTITLVGGRPYTLAVYPSTTGQ